MTIDHEGPVPLYQQLADLLRAQIESGELPPNRPIPTEQRLMQMHELGRDTVRRAVGILRDEGLLITVKARGTFVVDRSAVQDDA
ncbi:GntR family transcriptional regulator [Nonomuraea pusilla]|uniref:GntR family transcriptional regulator n=1 Tax=Nonomuraea pusilla TaxID=46177 RepID=UPI00332C4597